MTEETKPLVERLREACNGHPHAKIPWPHRLLHEAADRIAELEAIVGKVAESHRGGSKCDRPDYVAMVTCDVVYRAYRAMNRTPQAARQSKERPNNDPTP